VATHLAELFCRFSSVRNLAARGTDTVAHRHLGLGVGRACRVGTGRHGRTEGISYSHRGVLRPLGGLVGTLVPETGRALGVKTDRVPETGLRYGTDSGSFFGYGYGYFYIQDGYG
jgi:hypothetical protein